ncbi:L-tyrosine/L-tryptophan isonitrile synthase family protein [Micromonospora sp. KLBMP9576]|uniref:L-tyrosine/L-tryptophan isonitrile synthase family protein n=1 Tax=Micromonospora sp. KLBMP9576 TaxID=3424769 RepID=UPI003D93182D
MTVAEDEQVGSRERTLARQILELVFRFRRLEHADDPCGGRPCDDCFATHEERVGHYVRSGEPLHFVLPAFPAKSRNPEKVVGSLPDLGERISVEFLQSFCEQVSHYHPTGARILICSDGHVFSDLLGIPDEDVTAYRTELQRIIDQTGASSVSLYSLDDAFGAMPYDEMRGLLLDGYATPLEAIRAEVLTDVGARSLFNGMHRFMLEDQAPLHPGMSRTKLREHCKEFAYQMIRRSRAWGDLVGTRFPDSLRLSIHPQARHAEKIGLHLIRTRDSWLTPWHGVVLDDGDTLTLVKRSQAESYQASLVWRNGRPSHYVNPHFRQEEIAS